MRETDLAVQQSPAPFIGLALAEREKGLTVLDDAGPALAERHDGIDAHSRPIFALASGRERRCLSSAR